MHLNGDIYSNDDELHDLIADLIALKALLPRSLPCGPLDEAIDLVYEVLDCGQY